MTVPQGGGKRDLGKVAPSPAPAPQLPPDDAKLALINRLASLPLSDLQRLEKQLLLNDLAELDPKVLQQLVETRRS